ncbi:hypothetical protein [Labrenzia sp. DG1229]|uniref:hypothetical protein n=1 Tax=Labrenzia sp. DG1229 TaxID=681847 RepID=UPI000691FEBD|nr:hypothetical protein [Labrenzia sp. DG1229]
MNDWDDDTPITLKEACEILFRGHIKPATLVAEAERGNLQLERIGRRYFTTPGAIKEMRERCRLQANAPTSAKNDTCNPHGKDQAKYALARLQKTIDELKQSSKK